ncbi:hypothetical protein RI054_01g06600 [Pseudoscourfieldia marina]
MPECKVSCASVALENAGSPTLKVPENVLSPGRYVFTMTVTDVNNGGLTATAKMAVVINSPPTQGIVLVEPLSGTELVERFAVFSAGFEDADVPLSYMYGVFTADGDAFPLTSAQATQYAELDLPSSATCRRALWRRGGDAQPEAHAARGHYRGRQRRQPLSNADNIVTFKVWQGGMWAEPPTLVTDVAASTIVSSEPISGGVITPVK